MPVPAPSSQATESRGPGRLGAARRRPGTQSMSFLHNPLAQGLEESPLGINEALSTPPWDPSPIPLHAPRLALAHARTAEERPVSPCPRVLCLLASCWAGKILSGSNFNILQMQKTSKTGKTGQRTSAFPLMTNYPCELRRGKRLTLARLSEEAHRETPSARLISGLPFQGSPLVALRSAPPTSTPTLAWFSSVLS